MQSVRVCVLLCMCVCDAVAVCSKVLKIINKIFILLKEKKKQKKTLLKKKFQKNVLIFQKEHKLGNKKDH